MSNLNTLGTKFYRGSGSGSITYTLVGGLTDAPPPGLKGKANDVTTMDQDDDFKHVEGSPLKEYDPIELELLLRPADAQQALLKADIGKTTPVPFRYEYRNGDTEDFSGVVTAYKPAGKIGENFKVKVTIEVDGESVYTEAI